ncbi:MAG: 2Fe-2S iron-sulfur cluster-binding protein [Candidatus Nanohaloarchaea archaeon]
MEHTVEYVGSGETMQVPENQTILRAAIEEGIAQEYSCRVGMCLACSAEIVEGEVAQPAARALTEEEKERYALTCMARPESDLKLRRGEYPPTIENDGASAGAWTEKMLEEGPDDPFALLKG